MDLPDGAAEFPARSERADDALEKPQLYVPISIGTRDSSAARIILVPGPNLTVRLDLARRFRIPNQGVKDNRSALAHVRPA